jgi:hypothetical protein
MMKYNNADPYPSCLSNLTEKNYKEQNSSITKNIDLLHSNLKILTPKYFFPFAGSYVVGGKNYYLNKFLETMTWDKCIEILKNKEKMQQTQYITLRERDIYLI